MKLNYDFYTFSPKHFKKVLNLLDEYDFYERGELYDNAISVVFALSEKGMVTIREKVFCREIDGKRCYGTVPFIKFWPHPKYIEYFRQFDKKKLVDLSYNK